MPTEDFTAYVENDGGADLTVTVPKIAISTVRYGQDGSNVSKDFGANHFDDWEWLYSCEHTQAGGRCGFFIGGVTNVVDECYTLWQANDDAVGMWMLKASGGAYGFYLRDMNNHNSDLYAHSLNTQYWCTFKRIGTTVTNKIYTDAARTVLVDTLTIQSVDVDYRYALPYAAINYLNDSVTASGYIENLDLQEGGETHTPSDTAKSSDALTFKAEVPISDTAKASDNISFLGGLKFAIGDIAKSSDGLVTKVEEHVVDTAKASDIISFIKNMRYVISDAAKASDVARFFTGVLVKLKYAIQSNETKLQCKHSNETIKGKQSNNTKLKSKQSNE